MTTERVNPIGLITGLTYSFPIEGAIRAGTTVKRTKNDRTLVLPSKLDEFILTTKRKNADGDWIRHELDAKLRDQYGVDEGEGARKLRRLPVTLAFDRPELSLSEQYAVFSDQGRPICVGNGSEARRRTLGEDGYVVESCACPGATNCAFGEANRCDTFSRILVRLEGQKEMDGLFILRTGSINGVTDTRAFVEHLSGMLGGRIAGVPLWLTLEPKQSAMSRQSVFWHASFRPRFDSLLQAAQKQRADRDAELEAGINREAGELALLNLRANGFFAEQADEDGAQFDDLIAARFMEDTDEGQRQVDVRARRRQGKTASPSAAGAHVVAELNQMLSVRSQSDEASGSAAAGSDQPAAGASAPEHVASVASSPVTSDAPQQATKGAQAPAPAPSPAPRQAPVPAPAGQPQARGAVAFGQLRGFGRQAQVAVTTESAAGAESAHA